MWGLQKESVASILTLFCLISAPQFRLILASISAPQFWLILASIWAHYDCLKEITLPAARGWVAEKRLLSHFDSFHFLGQMRQILFDVKWGQMRQILFEVKWGPLRQILFEAKISQNWNPWEGHGKRLWPQFWLISALISAHSLILIGIERSHDKPQEAELRKEVVASILTHFNLFPQSCHESRFLIGRSGERLQEDHGKRPKWVKIEAPKHRKQTNF